MTKLLAHASDIPFDETFQRVNGSFCSPFIKKVKHFSAFWHPFKIDVHLSAHPLGSFQLQVSFLARQLVPSSARHTPSTLQVTVLPPVILPLLQALAEQREMGL